MLIGSNVDEKSNPYSPPSIPSDALETRTDCRGLFRFRKSLVLNLADYDLPSVCFKTGAPTNSSIEMEGTVTKASSILVSGALFGAIGMLAAKYLLGTKVRFHLPLCDEKKADISNRAKPSWFSVWFGLATVWAGMCLVLVHDAFIIMTVIGFVVFGAALIYVYTVGRSSIPPFRITASEGDWVFINGINEDVLNTLPLWNR